MLPQQNLKEKAVLNVNNLKCDALNHAEDIEIAGSIGVSCTSASNTLYTIMHKIWQAQNIDFKSYEVKVVSNVRPPNEINNCTVSCDIEKQIIRYFDNKQSNYDIENSCLVDTEEETCYRIVDKSIYDVDEYTGESKENCNIGCFRVEEI